MKRIHKHASFSLSQHYTDNFLWIFKERKNIIIFCHPLKRSFQVEKKVSPFFCPVKNVSTPFSGLLLFWNKSIMHSVKFLLQNGSFQRSLQKGSSPQVFIGCNFKLSSFSKAISNMWHLSLFMSWIIKKFVALSILCMWEWVC